MLTVMPQSHTLSNHSRLSPPAKYQTVLDCFLADFQKSLNALARAWNKYQPNDSLSNDRKQDLDWLETTLQEYKISIHTSTSRQEFWKGCRDGKKSRRTISGQRLAKRRTNLTQRDCESENPSNLRAGVPCWMAVRSPQRLLVANQKAAKVGRIQVASRLSTVFKFYPPKG